MTVRIELKHINTTRKRLADGTVKLFRYHRRTGRPIQGEPGTAEFLASYQEAARGAAAAAQGDTIGALIERYLAAPEFLGLGEKTRRDYRRYLDNFKAAHGHGPRAALNDPRIRRKLKGWRNQWAGRPRAADYGWSVVSAWLEWAYDESEIAWNHARKGRRLYRSDRSERIWLPAHVATFCDGAAPELQWPLLLAIYTGQREADLLHLRWNQITADDTGRRWVRLRQRKTKRWVTIPLHRDALAVLASIPKRSTHVLTRPDGRPWPAEKGGLDYFRHQFRERVVACGLDKVTFEDGAVGDLHFHDLRGTAASNLRDAGCSEDEILEIIGCTRENLKSYLKRGSRPAALAAMVKLEAWNAG